MPYKSLAQARKFHAMLNRGEISAATVEEFDKATDFSKLPKRVKKSKHALGSHIDFETGAISNSEEGNQKQEKEIGHKVLIND